MQDPNSVFNLASPVRAETIARLQRYGTVRCRSTLSVEDCAQLNVHFENHPSALLHVCPPISATVVDATFLVHLPAVQRFWLQARPGELIDLASVAPLPSGLRDFTLDTLDPSGDAKRDRPKQSLDLLATLPRLERLSICGRLPSLDFVGALPALRSLGLWRTQLKTLAGMERLPGLQRLDLVASGAKDLTPLAALRELRVLHIDRQRDLAGLDAVATLHNLCELQLRASTLAHELPSFAALVSLRVAMLDNIATRANLECIAAAPQLRCLVLSRCADLLDVAAFAPLARHAHLRELRFDTGNEKLLEPIRAAYGWDVDFGAVPSRDWM